MKSPKFCRQNNICVRRSNIINHAGTHKCSSSYCQKGVRLAKIIYELQHRDARSEFTFVGKDGVKLVNAIQKECHMKFGQPLEFDHSGENNLN